MLCWPRTRLTVQQRLVLQNVLNFLLCPAPSASIPQPSPGAGYKRGSLNKRFDQSKSLSIQGQEADSTATSFNCPQTSTDGELLTGTTISNGDRGANNEYVYTCIYNTLANPNQALTCIYSNTPVRLLFPLLHTPSDPPREADLLPAGPRAPPTSARPSPPARAIRPRVVGSSTRTRPPGKDAKSAPPPSARNSSVTDARCSSR